MIPEVNQSWSNCSTSKTRRLTVNQVTNTHVWVVNERTNRVSRISRDRFRPPAFLYLGDWVGDTFIPRGNGGAR